MFRIYFVIAFFCFVFISCNEDGTEPIVEKTASQLIAEGWTAYSNKNYQTAISKFAESIQKDATISDAYNGTGWSLGKIDSLNLSVLSFQTALTRNSSNLEAQAGLAIDYNALKNYMQSNYFALSVLTLDSNWLFSHDTTVNNKDLNLLTAQNYFAQAKFDSSLLRVQLIDGSFSVDIGTLQGQASLAAKIEELLDN